MEKNMSNPNKNSVFGVELKSVTNKMEIKVIRVMNKILDDYPVHDQCPLCIQDTFALSLNRLPAKYAQFGTIVLKSEFPHDDEIYEVVANAIQDVGNKPKHN